MESLSTCASESTACTGERCDKEACEDIITSLQLWSCITSVESPQDMDLGQQSPLIMRLNKGKALLREIWREGEGERGKVEGEGEGGGRGAEKRKRRPQRGREEKYGRGERIESMQEEKERANREGMIGGAREGTIGEL